MRRRDDDDDDDDHEEEEPEREGESDCRRPSYRPLHHTSTSKQATTKKAATKKGNQKKESAAVDTDEPEVGGEDDEEEWNTCQLLLIDLGGASAPQQLRTECRKRKGEASSGDWYHIEDARCCVCSARLYNCDGKVDVEDLKIRSQAIEELELKGQSLGEVLSRWRLAVARSPDRTFGAGDRGYGPSSRRSQHHEA